MLDMFDVVDLTQAYASNPRDREMIMKYLNRDGGIRELQQSLKQGIFNAVLPVLAMAGELEQVKSILKNKAEVNTTDNNGLSALTYAQANLARAPGETAKVMVDELLAHKADPSRQALAVELVQMFDKHNRGVRQHAISEVRKYVHAIDKKILGKENYHAKALAIAEHLNSKQEAADLAKELEKPDASVKALALEGLVKTGRAALLHVKSIVACLEKMDYDGEDVVRKGAVQALHGLGPNAAHLAMPYLMKCLPTSAAGTAESVSELSQVLRVLQNFGVSIPPAFEAQVIAAALQLEQGAGGRQARQVVRLYECDSHFHMGQRLFPVPSHWDWRPDVIDTRRDDSTTSLQSGSSSNPFDRARKCASQRVDYYQLS
eukprot:6488128-Amphidinium_carterae.1